MISLWQLQVVMIASGVPIPAERGSPAGPNPHYPIDQLCKAKFVLSSEDLPLGFKIFGLAAFSFLGRALAGAPDLRACFTMPSSNPT